MLVGNMERGNLPDPQTQVFSLLYFWGGEGVVLSIMAYTGMFCMKGVPFYFHKLRYVKGWGNWSFRYLKGPLVILFRIDTPYGVYLLSTT